MSAFNPNRKPAGSPTGGQFDHKPESEADGGLGALGARVDPIDEVAAHDVARWAELGHPASADSSGSQYLDTVISCTKEYLTDVDGGVGELRDVDIHDAALEIAESAQPVYSDDIATTFTDLALWNEDLDHIPHTTRMPEMIGDAVTHDGRQLGYALCRQLGAAHQVGQAGDALERIKGLNAHELAHLADTGMLDSLESPGADYLASIRDDYVERYEFEDENNRAAWIQAYGDDAAIETADTVSAGRSTYTLCKAANDLGSARNDLSEYGYEDDLDTLMAQAVFSAGRRSATEILTRMREEESQREAA